MSADAAQHPILRITGLSKSFGPIRALRGVEFELRRGEIHALAGENGAGKSTLMNVIDGILAPDSGTIELDGQPVSIKSPAMAQKLGIGFVHQEIALCPDVTVAENIFMATTNSSRAPLMNYAALQARAADILRRLGDIDPAAMVRTLSISQQQLVEIAKALTLDCRVLIFDEPTAALTEREAKVLFEIMHKLAAQGISIIYITHRMAEIF
ncbi:MAG: ATP-binding cassette domain-containing protein, partial [Devosia sp.]